MNSIEKANYREHVRYGGLSTSDEFAKGIRKRRCRTCDGVFACDVPKRKTCDACKAERLKREKADWSMRKRNKGTMEIIRSDWADSAKAKQKEKLQKIADAIAAGSMPKDRPPQCRGVIFHIVGEPWRDPSLSDAQQYRSRYAHDLSFQIKERMRRQVSKAMKRDAITDVMRLALNRGGRSRKVERELGFTINQLHEHLEASFTDGMDWHAFQRGEIHIDHIIPQAAFDMSDVVQWRSCWSLSNLQPLCGKDNLAKSDRMPCGTPARRALAA